MREDRREAVGDDGTGSDSLRNGAQLYRRSFAADRATEV